MSSGTRASFDIAWWLDGSSDVTSDAVAGLVQDRPCHPVGSLIQLVVCQFLTLAADREVVGIAAYLLFETARYGLFDLFLFEPYEGTARVVASVQDR